MADPCSYPKAVDALPKFRYAVNVPSCRQQSELHTDDRTAQTADGATVLSTGWPGRAGRTCGHFSAEHITRAPDLMMS